MKIIPPEILERVMIERIILNEGYLNIPTYAAVLNLDLIELSSKSIVFYIYLTVNKPKDA